MADIPRFPGKPVSSGNLSESPLPFRFCRLIGRRDFCPSFLRFLGPPQFTKARHVRADRNRFLCFFFRDRCAPGYRKALSVRAGAERGVVSEMLAHGWTIAREG